MEPQQEACQEYDIRVRKGTLDDAETFYEFNRQLAYETEGLELPAERTRAAVVKALSNPEIGTYFLAWDENDPEKKPAGGCCFTREMSF